MCQVNICKYEHRDGYCTLPTNTKFYPYDADCNCSMDEFTQDTLEFNPHPTNLSI